MFLLLVCTKSMFVSRAENAHSPLVVQHDIHSYIHTYMTYYNKFFPVPSCYSYINLYLLNKYIILIYYNMYVPKVCILSLENTLI